MKNAGEIYRQYADEITRFCCSLMKDRDDGCDCAHEVFLTLLVKLPDMTDENLRGWLYATARFKACNMLRARLHCADIEDYAENVPDRARTERAALLRVALNLLGDEQCRLLTRRYIEMQPASYLAELEGISEQALNKRLRKYREELKLLLENYSCVVNIIP